MTLRFYFIRWGLMTGRRGGAHPSKETGYVIESRGEALFVWVCRPVFEMTVSMFLQLKQKEVMSLSTSWSEGWHENGSSESTALLTASLIWCWIHAKKLWNALAEWGIHTECSLFYFFPIQFVEQNVLSWLSGKKTWEGGCFNMQTACLHEASMIFF